MPPAVPASLSSKLLASVIPSSPFLRQSGSLCQILSTLPKDGVGAKVTQSRWEKKGIENSYWEVTRVRLRNEGRNGKVWGRLIWKGRPLNENDELIRKGLKYSWKRFDGVETRTSLPTP